MALKAITSFNWEKILSKVDNPEISRSFNALKGKANEILVTSDKFVKPVASIPFDAYKKKLRFTSSAVDALENVYKSRTLPAYYATTPPFIVKKRELTLTVVNNIVNAAKADLEEMKIKIKEFEATRFNGETSTAEALQRFPQFARETEAEIRDHLYFQDGKLKE